ncbi:MAG: LPS assembly lipoprotein LptE [Pseudomonadota bacterium]
MSSNGWHRRWVLSGLCASAGCGFAPAFAPDGTAAAWQNAIVVEAPDTVFGFRMRGRLLETLGTPTAPQFALTLTPRTAPVPATITEEGDITRFNITGNAEWVLVDQVTGETVQSGLVQTFTSYSATSSTVATQAAESDARDRLAVALADLVVQQLLTAS